MIRSASAFRALAVTAVVVLAGSTLARAAETTVTTTVETKTETKFMPTIYFGPGFGWGHTDDDDSFAWSIWSAMRLSEYGAIQIEYFDAGGNGIEGGYFGLMPILPVAHGLTVFGQVGLAVADAGDDVAGGGGLMYVLPIEWFEKNHVDVTARLDYKYLNLDDGVHMLTFGFMMGLHK